MAKKKPARKGSKSKPKTTVKPLSKAQIGSKAFWKIYRTAKAYSAELGQPYDAFELRALAKDIQELYFKGKSESKISKKDIEFYTFLLTYEEPEIIYGAEPAPPVPPADDKDWFNPLRIPTPTTSSVDWWAIESFFLDTIIPNYTQGKKMNVILDAGQLGRREFNVINFSYEGLGLSGLVEAIREWCGNDSPPEWNGFAVLMSGQPDNGLAYNYALKLVLFDANGNPLSSIEEALAPIPKGSTEEQRLKEIKKHQTEKASEAQKKLQEELDKAKKRQKVRPSKKEKVESGTEPTALPATRSRKKGKEERITDAVARRDTIKEFKDMILQSRKDYDDGILDKKEYLAEKKRIESLLEEAIKKFKRGGQI